MADSRDKDEESAQPAPPWQECFARFLGSAAEPASASSSLDVAWRAAVDRWWDGVAAVTAPEAQELLKPAVDQARALIDLANEAGRKPVDSIGDDILWRQPLLLWEQAAERMFATQPPPANTRAAAPVEALGDYQQALRQYSAALRSVSATALAEVSDAWAERNASRQPGAGLRELFDLYVDLSEHHYHELVASDEFARIGGRLINSLVECVQQGRKRTTQPGSGWTMDTLAGQSERIEAANAPHLLDELGIGLEQTMTELEAFAEKLNAGVQTLRDLGTVAVGMSKRQVVHREGKLTLYRYTPSSAPTNPIPVLIVYALANRPYMMDLQPQRSLIRGLMDRGLEVYLIDWGYPDENDSKLGLNDYVNRLIGACVDKVRDRHGLARINLLGVCQGGTFSLCYAALHPEKTRNLVLMVTPVDFHTADNLLTTWLRHVDVDRLVDVLGNVPGELLNWAFVSMKPLRLTGQKYLDMLNLLDDEEKARTFLRMEKWINDSPAQAGECFRQFAKDLFQKNKLIDGGLRIGAQVVDLRDVCMPVLNVYATQDHIVPPGASLALEGRIACTDYTTVAFEGGHIGMYVSARAQREVPRKIAEWLHARCDSRHETSP